MPIMLRRGLAAAALVAAAAGCQLKSSPVPPNFVTADPSAFTLKSVQRYQPQQAAGADTMIVAVEATYTDTGANPQPISADHFQLLDPTLMAVYVGVSGGDINIPSMPPTTVQPGKSVDIAVGFRVPASMTGARLTYRE